MGAKFAPNVTNIFMAQWEEEAIYQNTPKELLLCKLYIILIWKGTETDLLLFLEKLNQNDQSITFKWEHNTKQIHFLDLTVSLTEGKFKTKTFFKMVDRNGYTPLKSCHYAPWLLNVPKGQFMRLKRNCTDEQDYKDRSNQPKTS